MYLPCSSHGPCPCACDSAEEEGGIVGYTGMLLLVGGGTFGGALRWYDPPEGRDGRSESYSSWCSWPSPFATTVARCCVAFTSVSAFAGGACDGMSLAMEWSRTGSGSAWL